MTIFSFGTTQLNHVTNFCVILIRGPMIGFLIIKFECGKISEFIYYVKFVRN